MEKLICPDCGNTVDMNMDVCINCGCPKEYFEPDGKSVKCPECGQITISSKDYCPNCGCPMSIIMETNSNEKELSSEEKKRLARERRKQRSSDSIKNEGGVPNDIEDFENEKLRKLANGELHIPIDEPPPKKEKESFVTKVAGVTFENRQQKIENLINNNILYIGARLQLKPEPYNAYDSFAVQVLSSNGVQIGYLPKGTNKVFFQKLQSRVLFDVRVVSIGGGGSNYNYGITIEIKER